MANAEMTLDSTKSLLKRWDESFEIDDLTQEHVDQMNEKLHGLGTMEKARAIWNVLADEGLVSSRGDEEDVGVEEEFIDFVLAEESDQ